MAVVIVLSVFLIASVVTIVNSVDLTVTTIYNYTKIATPIIPQRSALSVDSDSENIVKRQPGIDRMMDSAAFFMNINTVFGRVPFICFALNDGDRAYLLRRSGDRLTSGRMPIAGRPEAVLSEGLVRNKKLKLGDVVAGPTDEGGISGAPVPVKLVGILSGPSWIAFTSRAFADIALPAMPTFLLVTARVPSNLPSVSASLDSSVDHSKVQVLSNHNLVQQLRDSLASMYLIMTLVNAMVILVVAIMSGMLSNIYFTQRLSEFAVLAAIGMKRSILIWHAVSETAILTAFGWVLGIIVTWTSLSYMRGTVFEPRGMLIDPHDMIALLYTIPIPVIITIFAVATISYRMSRLDPVAIIERR
jgi:ABC-type antimicrobial peptide transport system permease subunit